MYLKSLAGGSKYIIEEKYKLLRIQGVDPVANAFYESE